MLIIWGGIDGLAEVDDDLSPFKCCNRVFLKLLAVFNEGV